MLPTRPMMFMQNFSRGSARRHENVYYLRFVVEKPFPRPTETREFCQSVVSVPALAIKVKTWLRFLLLQVYFGPTAASCSGFQTSHRIVCVCVRGLSSCHILCICCHISAFSSLGFLPKEVRFTHRRRADHTVTPAPLCCSDL